MSGARLKFRGSSPPAPDPPPSEIAVPMRAHSKQSLASDLTSVLAYLPTGNDVTLTIADDTLLKATLTETYVLGTNVMPAPSGLPYTGVEGSYYASAGYPASPTLVTAYAGVQCKTVWRQQFDDRLVVIVKAWAIGGIDHVVGYAEGATLTVSTATNYLATDPNGYEEWHHDVYVFEFLALNYTATAWSAVAAGSSGDATRGIRLFFEAVPTNLYDAGTNPTGIQPQVVGGNAATAASLQYVFYPVVELYDYLITVNTDLPVAEDASNPKWITGVAAANFHNESDALAYAGGATRPLGGGGITRNVTMLRPQILTQTSGVREYTTHPNGGGPGQLGRGYATWQCDTGVTVEMGKTAWDSADLVWRPGFQGVRILGPGITLNSTNWYTFRQETSGPGNWFDAVVVTADLDLHTYVDAGGNVRGYNSAVPEGMFNTNCRTEQGAPASNPLEKISHHNTRIGVNVDFGGILWVQSEEVVYGMSCIPFFQSKDAFTLTASASGWSVQKTGSNGSVSSTMLFIKDGVTQATLTLGYKLVSTFVDEVNANASLSEITAALLNVTPNDGVTDRGMPYSSNTTGVAGTFTQALTSGVARSFYTYPDIHLDGWQPTVSQISNLYFGDILFFDTVMQDFLMGFSPSGCRLENVAVDSDSLTYNHYAQWPNGIAVVTTNNLQVICFSDTGGLVLLGNTNSSTVRDGYCQLVSNVWLQFSRSTGANLFANTAYPIVTSSHFGSATNLTTAYMTPVNTTTGGTQATMFPDRAIQNLTPDQAVVGVNQVGDELPPFDAQGVTRGSAAVKGALVAGLPSGTTLTAAELATLCLVTPSDTTGSPATTATLSFKDRAGETGNTVTVTLNVNVVAR